MPSIKKQIKTTSTPAIDRILKKKYLEVPIKVLAKEISKSYTFVVKRLEQLNLVIPKEILLQRKRNNMFSVGFTPANKGKKMSKELYEKVKHTFYKKGNIPYNAYANDGVISVRKDSSSDRSYQHIRIGLGKWQLLHKYIYEKEFGPIPRNYCLWFKDGNTNNVCLENLELITRAENMVRNSHLNIHPELKSTIKLINKIKKQTKNYEFTNKTQH